MTTNFVEELKWRGMVYDMTPGTMEQLANEQTSGYVGFDPTADSLHIGNLVQIMTLVHFQRAGHKPIALVGGATGMVGDPSGKSDERNLLSEDVLRHNEAAIHKQLKKFLDFDQGANAAEMVNNFDWFKNYAFLDFIRDVGKHISISYMLAKDSVKSRLETGLSFTEFSYQLVQGYDFYWLHKNKDCRLQMGGSDQWGNILTGTELIRRKGGGEAFALTTPLITKADGTKFGKTEQGNVWLDPARTSPYQFYQYWLNTSDEDAARFIKIFSTMSQKDITELVTEHGKEPHARELQKTLAQVITTTVHSATDCAQVVQASQILFGKSVTSTLAQIKESTLLSVLAGVPKITISRDAWEADQSVVDLVSVTIGQQIFSSKGEARKMIAAGGLSINKAKITDPHAQAAYVLLHDKYLLVQKGRKNYFLVIVEHKE